MALNRTRTQNTGQTNTAETTSPGTTGKEIVPALRAAGLQAIELPGGRDNVKRYLVTGTAPRSTSGSRRTPTGTRNRDAASPPPPATASPAAEECSRS